MKKFFNLLLFLILIGTLYYVANNWSFIKKSLIKIVPQADSYLEVAENIPEGKITSASFEDCKVSITDTSGERYYIGRLGGEDNPVKGCTNGPRFAISDSGKYMVFEDVAGGVDLWIRIYSIERNKINTLAVWGTSSLLDLEFLSNDKLILFNGYADIPDEQWLKLFDIPAVYTNYSLIADTDYLRTDKYESVLTITPAKGDFFDIVEIGNKVSVFGGSSSRPILRGDFSVSSL